jgi:hypothetical protein
MTWQLDTELDLDLRWIIGNGYGARICGDDRRNPLVTVMAQGHVSTIGGAYQSATKNPQTWPSPSSSLSLPPSFLSSMVCGGVASYSFVWDALGSILCAQLALGSRRTQETTFATTSTAICASTTEKAAI